MKVAVVSFPGTNCDVDCAVAWERILNATVSVVRHVERIAPGTELVVLPGGFSHGDYLRCGALAAVAPVMDSVAAHAAAGGLVLGICNGFQILCEAGLLPGVLRRNRTGRFVCREEWLRVERADSPFTAACPARIRLPIAHGEGAYWADEGTLAELEESGRVLLRYECNPNGSRNDIAAIRNAAGNVAGMMPHPERACDARLGGTDGIAVLRSVLVEAMR